MKGIGLDFNIGFNFKDINKNNFVYYLICLYVILYPFGSSKLKISSIPINGDLIFLVILISYFVSIVISLEVRNRFIDEFNEFFFNPLSICMYIVFALMIASVKYSMEADLALKESLRFLSYIVIFFIAKSELRCENRIRGLIKCFYLLLFTLCILGIIQFFTRIGLDRKFIYDNLGFSFNTRIQCTTGNPNTYGGFLILFLFPFLTLFVEEKDRTKKNKYGLLCILMLINIVMTGSRNAWLAFIVGALILGLIYSKKIIGILSCAGVIALLIPKMRGRLQEFTDMSQNDSRIKLYRTALKMIKDNPIWGVGNGNYVAYYAPYTKRYPYLGFGIKRYAVHNSYLKVFSELGIFGIGAFIGLVLFVLLKMKWLIKNLEYGRTKVFFLGVMTSIICFFIMNIFDNLFFVPKAALYFWVLLALAQAQISLVTFKK